jgi:hypothetical protein
MPADAYRNGKSRVIGPPCHISCEEAKAALVQAIDKVRAMLIDEANKDGKVRLDLDGDHKVPAPKAVARLIDLE